jgi:hypothetical protein
MPLNKTLRSGAVLTVGNASIEVRWARRGEVRLIITAPPEVRIREASRRLTKEQRRD